MRASRIVGHHKLNSMIGLHAREHRDLGAVGVRGDELAGLHTTER